ncbi:MAG: ABC transporter permease [Planctomycetota bacterium]
MAETRQRSQAELEELLEEARKLRGNSLWSDAMRRFRRNRVAFASFWFLVLLSVVSFLAPLLPLASPHQPHLDRNYAPPGFSTEEPWSEDQYVGLDDMNAVTRWMIHARASIFGDFQLGPWMGRDASGRCLMSRIVWGGRMSLLVGLAATLVSLLIGVSYGALSGYLGGRADNLMMRIVDMLYAIPFIFVVIFLITVIRERKDVLDAYGLDRVTAFFIVIGAIYWLTMARVVRGQVLSVKHREFVEAAQAQGASTFRILRHHIVPNVFSVVLVYLTLTIPRVMLFEAFLSFLGLGVEPPDVSWGMLAADGMGAINGLEVYWWFVLFPGLALGLTLLALNFLGDGLRDALDPRLAQISGKAPVAGAGGIIEETS